MHLLTWLVLLAGLGLLVAGAELFVRGASRLAAAAGVSPLVIGLTIVAFGTSAPEMAVSARAAVAGASDIALGNVVGSNIFNVLFILGLSALAAPLIVSVQLIRREVPLMIAVSALPLLMGLDGRVGRLDAAALVVGIVAYTLLLIRHSRRESQAAQEFTQEYSPAKLAPTRDRRWLPWALLAAGLGLLVWGTEWFVGAATDLAAAMGVSELVIGLTVVAAGTSMPEVATSVVATLRGERDIAVGNVVGSNIFNVLGILGVAALLRPIPVPASALAFDLPVMLAVAVACLPIFFTGRRIARWEGALFLAYYAAYTLYLFLRATQHDALHGFSRVMLWFILPLTAATLVALSVREARGERRQDAGEGE